MRSHHQSGGILKKLFGFGLAALGKGLELTCRRNATFRKQVTREVTVQIGSAEGVFHHYLFTPRAVTSRRGPAVDPTLSLCFDNARLGILTLASPRAVGKIVHALQGRRAEYRGNAVLLLWFYGLTRFVLPIGKTGRLRVPPPDAYVEPSMQSKVAKQIVREASVEELDPAWEAAHRQRAKMIMIRGSAGEAVAMW